jgi:hypothetical protein
MRTDVYQALNRAFLLIQDFQFSEYPIDSQWTLLISKDLPSTAPGATPIPLPDVTNNAFASMSLADINAFVRANEDGLSGIDVSSGDWVIIDQKGLETSTCLVCEQVYDFNGEEDGQTGGLTREFRACRIPYEVAWGMIANLDIANTNFEDWVDEEAGVQEGDLIWKWRSFVPDMNDPEEKTPEEIKREKALKQLRDAGHAD